MQSQEASEATSRLQGFEEFVRSIMQDWKVPGAAVAVVKDGEVIFSRGFGKRDVAGDLDVTSQTLFPIASCTKAFTTTAMAMLADDGKLDWDTPVNRYLPTFKLYDLLASTHMTPRDLVTHRSGLPRHDLMWYNSSYTRQELFDRLQYLEPSKDFRAVLQYQNLMYMVAGYLVGQLADQSWEDFVQQRIFNQLGMSSSLFSTSEAQETTDFSFPYKEEKDEVKKIPFEPTVKDIVFKRLPARELTDKSFLEQFVGEYDVIGMTLTIALKGEKALVVSLPMQPEFELVPYKGTTFHLKGLSGFSIEFKSDAAGVVTEAIVEQPSGVVTATKKVAS